MLIVSACLATATATVAIADDILADQFDLRTVEPMAFNLGSIGNLALDVGLPADGYQGDRLNRLNVINTGDSQFGEDISKMEAWADQGDGNFDPVTDMNLGEFSFTGTRWELTGLDHPVPVGQLRIYITVDIATSGIPGRTIQLGLPSLPDLGVGLASGSGGPTDQILLNPVYQSLSISDRVILSTEDIPAGIVVPGQPDVPLMHLVSLNSYTEDRRLVGLTVTNGSGGPGSPTIQEKDGELEQVFLRQDGDDDGMLGDLAVDPVLATGHFTGGEVTFSGLDWDLAAGSINHLFMTGTVSLNGAPDGGLLAANIASGIHLVFATATELTASWPLDSGAAWIVDGMVADQVVNHPVPAVTLAAGEGPALVLDMVVPSNGYANDTLTGLLLTNLGTADEFDIADLRLWQDGGDGVFSAGAGDDIELGPCTWVDDAWRSPILNVSIVSGGTRIFGGLTVAAAPANGATVGLAVPVDGIVVDSGNIGPLDRAVENPVTTLLSTAPLLSDVQFSETASTVGQTVTARMRVRNVGNEELLGVTPGSLQAAGDGALTFVGGPVPAWVDLAPGGVESFTWTYTAATAGGVVLSGNAEGTGAVGGQLRASHSSSSAEHRVYEPATGIELFAVTSMPFTINRGQTDVVPLSLTFFNRGDDSGADGQVSGLRICLKDGQGNGIVPADLLSRVVVNEGGITYLDKTVLETSGDQIILNLDRAVRVTHHEPVTLSIRLDIRGDTTVPDYLVEITSDSWITTSDAVSGLPIPVALQDGSFPIRSGLGTLLLEATSLQVDSLAAESRTVGVGQSDVTLLEMELLNPGTASLGSEIRVGSLAFSLTDTLGSPVATPGQVLESIRVHSSVQTLLELSLSGHEGTTVVLDLASPLSVPVDTPLPLTLVAQIQDSALAGAVQARLAPAASFQALDGNSGEPVTVIYGSDPVAGGILEVQRPAVGLAAQGDALFPEDLVIGARNVPAVTISLRHPGLVGEAPVLVSSVQVESRNENRDLISPADLIDRLTINRDGSPVGVLSNPTGDGIMMIALTGISLSVGQTVVLDLILDLEADAPTGSLELMIPGDGVAARDANLDTAVPVLPEMGVSFPLTSGVTRLQESADELVVGFANLLPPVLLDLGADFPAAVVSLRNPQQSGTSGIDLASITIRATDDQQLTLPVGRAVEEIILMDGDQIWASSGSLSLEDSTSTLASVGTTFIGPNQTLDLEMLVRFRSPPGVQGLRLGIAAGDVQVNQPEGALVLVRVEPENGYSFPFWTEIGSFTGASLSASYANFPNPFGPGRETTTFVFSLERPATVSLKLLTAHSRPVISLIDNESRPAGLYQEDTWDGRNGRGVLVQNGVYIAELLAVYPDGSQDRQLRKVAVVR